MSHTLSALELSISRQPLFEKSQKPIDKVGNARYNQKHQIRNSYMITRKREAGRSARPVQAA